MGLLGLLLKILKYLTLVTLCLLLIADLPLLLFLLNAKAALLEPTTYSKALKDNNAYATAREAAVNKGFEVLEDNNQLKDFRVPKSAVKTAVERIFTDEWLESQTDRMLQNFFSYLKGEKQTLSLNVSLKAIKANIVPETQDLVDEVFEEQADRLLDQYYRVPGGAPCQSLEECEQLCNSPQYAQLCQQFASQFGVEEVSVQAIKNHFKRQVQANLSSQLEFIPDSVDLAEPLKNDAQTMESFEQVRETIQTFYTALNVLLIATIALILLIAIVAFIPFHPVSAIRWVGFPLFISGTITALAAHFGPAYLQQAANQQIPPELAAETLFTLAKNIVFSIISQIASTTLLQAAIIAALGFILFTGSFFLSIIIAITKRVIKMVKH